MPKFKVRYQIGSDTITQEIEGEDADFIRDSLELKSSWIKDNRGNNVYINFDRVDTIKITPVVKSAAIRTI
ncbi:MAG TPA: hypothetical protein VEY51_20880 [Chondromyces sp.]|nr:hypothetical protein [Chondromyces sp.]